MPREPLSLEAQIEQHEREMRALAKMKLAPKVSGGFRRCRSRRVAKRLIDEHARRHLGAWCASDGRHVEISLPPPSAGSLRVAVRHLPALAGLVELAIASSTPQESQSHAA